MSKVANHERFKFVDPERTISRTPINMSKWVASYLERLETLRMTIGCTPDVKDCYKGLAIECTIALLFNQKPAAYILAYLYTNGLGIQKNLDAAKLWVAVGDELGHGLCLLLKRGIDPEAMDMKAFLDSKPVFEEALIKKAKQYAEFVKAYNTKIGENTLITFEIFRDIGHELSLSIPNALFTFMNTDGSIPYSSYQPRDLSLDDELFNNLTSFSHPTKQPQPSSSSTPSSSVTSSTVNWQNAGAAKITDIKDAQGAIYGQIYDQDVTRQFNFKVNGYPVTIIKYRSITMPDQIKPGETFDYSFALKQPDGLNISKTDAAYLTVKYNSYGKLVKLSVPGNPATSQNDPYAPAIVVYHNKVYTLPVSSGHYWHLKQVVESNSGSFEIQNPGPMPHVESIIPTMPIMHHGQYQQPLIALQPSDHHVPLAGSAYPQHNSEDTGCCILM